MHPFAHRFRIIIFLTVLLSTGSVFADNYRLITVAENFNFPWSIEFLPNGDRIVAELAGNLRRIAADGTVGPNIDGVPAVYRESQGGLFDVLMHPEFSQNNTIYLSYAAGDKHSNATTVARAKLSQSSLTNVEVIYTAAPHKYAPLHYGGRLAWLPDGTLLLTVGDGFDFREQAQNLGTHFGKTIRIQADGSPASDNPFPKSPYVWTYGHRNPQGLTVSNSGVVFQHEHGPQGGDEINVLEPGKNYGWPAITHGMDYNGAYVSPFTELAGMEQPKHVWVPSIAPSGLMIYEGTQFPAWKNSLFVGALVDMEVRRLEVDGTSVSNEETLFSEIGERIRDLREAPDGSIYILTDGPSGKVIQVLPAQ